MSTIAWIPKGDLAVHGDKTILSIYACAQPTACVSPSNEDKNESKIEQTNHWTLFCNLPECTSICFDPSPSGPNMSMVLMASYQENIFRPGIVKTVQIDATGLIVKDFVDVLESSKYDKYQFSASGQGCRYWMHRVVELLQSKGNLEDGKQVSLALEALGRVWALNGELAPAEAQTDMVQGRFWELNEGGKDMSKALQLERESCDFRAHH